MRPVPKVLRAVLLLATLVNFIYLSSCIIFYAKKGITRDSILYNKKKTVTINYDEIQEPLIKVNFEEEVNRLLNDAQRNPDIYWQADTSQLNSKAMVKPELFFASTSVSEAWSNKNTLFYDIRVTLALYLSYIRNRMQDSADDVAVPFHWADWVDLRYLNDNELAKPLVKRKKCRYLRSHSEGTISIRKEDLQCVDNHDVSAFQIEKFGFERREQLPGYIVKGHCTKKAYIDTRVSQARSYLLTHMPNPFRIIFLNKDQGTYEVNVDQGSRTRIVKSDLMKTYLKENEVGETAKGKITLDPVKEYEALCKTCPSKSIQASNDAFHIYNYTHSHDISKSKVVDLPQEVFEYSPQVVNDQVVELNALSKARPLSKHEISYFESLNYSSRLDTHHEWVFFRQATLRTNGIDKDNVDKDPGYHYDWRFFTGTLGGVRPGWTNSDLNHRQNIILDRMLRSWSRFAHEKGLVSWIMHGPLLSWYWNGMMFPFDNDIDIQMPIKELARLGRLYNQTLVIEDIQEGFGKYLIDVGTFIHNRDISQRENHIDARFIDVDSGLYIDITGLSTSDVQAPSSVRSFGIVKTEENKSVVYNDRRKHWYMHDQLSPLKYTLLGGVPVFVPSEIAGRLQVEYKSGVSKPEYSKWHYVPRLRLWVHTDKLTPLFDANDFQTMSANDPVEVDSGKVAALVLDMSDDQILTLLRADRDILIEYYKTKNITDIHEREKQFLFLASSSKVSDKVIPDNEIDEYNKFVTENVKMQPPLRSSFFQYENFDQKLHRMD